MWMYASILTLWTVWPGGGQLCGCMHLYIPCGLYGLEEASYVDVFIYTYPVDCMAWGKLSSGCMYLYLPCGLHGMEEASYVDVCIYIYQLCGSMYLYFPYELHGLVEASYVAVCSYTYPADCVAWRKSAMWLYVSIPTLWTAWPGGSWLCGCMYL